MLEMNNLHQIINDFEPLKSAIDKTIKEKMFIRQGFKKNIPNLSENEQLLFISHMLGNQKTFLCIKINNMIEWTPIKIFQSAYFIIYLYDKYWIVKRDGYSCSVILSISLKNYIQVIFEEGIRNEQYIPFQLYLCPKLEEFNAVIHNLLKSDVVYVKKDKYNINNKLVIINHYLYKNNNDVYYIPVWHTSTITSIYKPQLYCKMNSIKPLN